MKRKPLKNGMMLHLKNAEGQIFSYVIDRLIYGGDFGSSCLCYIAEKETRSGRKKVLLKEFYPVIYDKNAAIIRKENGCLETEKIEERKWQRLWKRFERGTAYLGMFKKNQDTEQYICAEEDVEPLYGYGTVYCENQYISSAVSWERDIRENGEKADEILQTAIGVHQFLRQVHKRGLAYVDLKPSDILLPKSEIRGINNAVPLFYDFNSMLEMGAYRAADEEIACTKEYQPPSFQAKSENDVILVDLGTEYYTYGAILQSLLKEKMQTLSGSVRHKLNDLFDSLMGKHGECPRENEIEEKLRAIRDQVQNDEYEEVYKKLPERIKVYHGIHECIMVLTIAMYIFTAGVVGYLCLNKGMARNFLGEKYEMPLPVLIILMIFVVALLTGLKIINIRMAIKLANSTVSCYYYKTGIRTGEYNTFRLGKRKRTTLQDTHKSNADRQRMRHVLWVALGMSLAAALIHSFTVNALPVFIAEGCMILLVFTFADFLPAIKVFYRNYAGLLSVPEVRGQDGKAAFFQQEYEQTDGTFDLKHEFYRRNRRNLFKIRKTVCRECFEDARVYPKGALRRVQWYLNHQYRRELVNQYQMKDEKQRELKFAPFEIQHVYKMRFDRFGVFRLVLTIVVTLCVAAAVFMGFAACTGFAFDYFCISEKYYLLITFALLAGATVVSCYQIAFSLRDETLAALMSYKSRYIIDGALNDELVRDIAAGFIKPVDLARGIYQYTGYIFTEEDSGFVKALKLEGAEERNIRPANDSARRSAQPNVIPLRNRFLLHHSLITGQSRLALAGWLSFAILFSIFVWYLKLYWMFPVLLIVAVCVHLYLKEYLINKIRTRRVIKEIQKLNKRIFSE